MLSSGFFFVIITFSGDVRKCAGKDFGRSFPVKSPVRAVSIVTVG
jgi:hypothetical protein